MTDIQAQSAPAPADPFADWSLDALDAERRRLIGSADTADELSESDLRKLVNISRAMRLRARPAGKPASRKASKPDITEVPDDFFS